MNPTVEKTKRFSGLSTRNRQARLIREGPPWARTGCFTLSSAVREERPHRPQEIAGSLREAEMATLF